MRDERQEKRDVAYYVLLQGAEYRVFPLRVFLYVPREICVKLC